MSRSIYRLMAQGSTPRAVNTFGNDVAAAFVALARQIPIVLISAAGEIAAATEEAERALGVPKNGLVGRAWADVCRGPGGGSQESVRSYLSLCARTRSPLPATFSREIRGVDRRFPCEGYAWEGQAGYVLLHIIQRAESSHRFILMNEKLAELNAEILRRKATETRLRDALAREHAAQAAALEASRVKDEFLAMLGHELRNPLAPITVALRLMRMRGADTFDKELCTIERQMNLLVRLVEDLLDVAGLERGKITLDESVLSVADLVTAAVEVAGPLFEQKGHHLRVESDCSDAHVKGDASRLIQVLSNLLMNAAKYTPSGGEISVKVEASAEQVRIRVRDTGLGIRADLLPRIFERFVQERQTLERASGGLGLGLAIVKSIVLLHGGTVEARSEGPGRGSEFVVSLARELAPLKTEPRALSRPAPMGSAQDHRILVVDDNRDGAEVLAAALRQLGYDVREAFDAQQALGVLDSFRPTVALLDIGLPDIDGYELASRIQARADGPLLLIAVTGYAQARDRELSRLAGFEHHIAKPVELSLLDELIRGSDPTAESRARANLCAQTSS